ncbi:type II toxin-antitoxin system PemK/MazF family toxin [Sphingomonas sp.]|uniref:type II toxin-antitoxin system PemK/MazF family toxin n=1 Tax=Sphingomonas sp. TaxID=28214 RepID=UPI00286ABCF1|nr:type II toxin-antitoxin system PemK/MazF family toxin [Sphingomonas sp.]
MALREHPPVGLVLTCNFEPGFRAPEMVKRRPVVVISPKMRGRPDLCTVVALSTTPPVPPLACHAQIDIRPKLPDHWESDGVWVKGDMIYTVALHRLDFIRIGKDRNGKRMYYLHSVGHEKLTVIRRCVLSGIGLGSLTNHL